MFLLFSPCLTQKATRFGVAHDSLGMESLPSNKAVPSGRQDGMVVQAQTQAGGPGTGPPLQVSCVSLGELVNCPGSPFRPCEMGAATHASLRITRIK